MLQAGLLIQLLFSQLVKVELDGVNLLLKGRYFEIHRAKVPLSEVLKHVEHALSLGLKKHLLIVFQVVVDFLHQLLQGGLILILLREAEVFGDTMYPRGELMMAEGLERLEIKYETFDLFFLGMILQLAL